MSTPQIYIFCSKSPSLHVIIFSCYKKKNTISLPRRSLPKSKSFHEHKYLFSRRETFSFMNKNIFFMKIIRQSCSLNIQTAKHILCTFGFTTYLSQYNILHPTIYSIVFNPQHQWCLPTAPHVLTTNKKMKTILIKIRLISSKQTYKP